MDAETGRILALNSYSRHKTAGNLTLRATFSVLTVNETYWRVKSSTLVSELIRSWLLREIRSEKKAKADSFAR